MLTKNQHSSLSQLRFVYSRGHRTMQQRITLGFNERFQTCTEFQVWGIAHMHQQCIPGSLLERSGNEAKGRRDQGACVMIPEEDSN